jgi:hypothetical protein
MKIGSGDPLVVNAAMFRVDIYGAGVRCVGASIAPSNAVALMSHSYEQGQAIALDVPPGAHTLVLTTYADAAAQHVLGFGCTATTLSPGAQVCFDITLTAVRVSNPDGGQSLSCTSNAQCTATDDAGAASQQCCGNGCVNVESDVDNCGGCSMACSRNHVSPSCTGGHCHGTCLAGYGDCNGDKRTDGCETALDSISNCGACDVSCDTTNSVGASCTAGTCVYSSCQSGFIDCNKTAPNSDGCECATATAAAQGTAGCCGTGCQTKHDNGLSDNFYDCAATGTHDAAEALAACVAHTGDKAKCYNYPCNGVSTSVYCDSNCSSCKCNCWEYGGTGNGNPGHVNQDGYCAGSSDPAWN